MKYQEVKGDLIEMALAGDFDVIAHGCNCFCKQRSGIAKQMVENFSTHLFESEGEMYKGLHNKLGTIDSEEVRGLIVINCYTQYSYGYDGNKYLDYEALQLCLRKINHLHKGKHVGLPKIGCGLAGGDWRIVNLFIKNELKDCEVTVVELKN